MGLYQGGQPLCEQFIHQDSEQCLKPATQTIAGITLCSAHAEAMHAAMRKVLFGQSDARFFRSA